MGQDYNNVSRSATDRCYPSAVEIIEIVNPATNQPVGRVQAANAQSVLDAVLQARSAQPAWHAKGWAQRAKVIRRFHDLMLDRNAQIFDTIQSETGKARRDAL